MTAIVVILSALVAALAASNLVTILWLIRLEGESRTNAFNIRILWGQLTRVGIPLPSRERKDNVR